MKPFYVGKGKGKRVERHEAEAKKGVCSKKCNKINSIIKSGGSIIKEKIAYFACETTAYDFEKQTIEFIGLDNLANIHIGGQGSYSVARPSQAKEKEVKPFTPELAMSLIYKEDDRFAWWAKYSQRGKYVLTFDYGDIKLSKFYSAISESCTKLMEMIYKKAIEDESNRILIKDLLLCYNVNYHEA